MTPAIQSALSAMEGASRSYTADLLRHAHAAVREFADERRRLLASGNADGVNGLADEVAARLYSISKDHTLGTTAHELAALATRVRMSKASPDPSARA